MSVILKFLAKVGVVSDLQCADSAGSDNVITTSHSHQPPAGHVVTLHHTLCLTAQLHIHLAGYPYQLYIYTHT